MGMNSDQPKKFLNSKLRDKKMLWNDIMDTLSKLKAPIQFPSQY